MILALDLGSKTGLAAYDDNAGTITVELHEFKNSKYEGAGMRYLRFRRWLQSYIETGEVRALFFEAVRRHIGTDAAHAYGAYLGQVTSLCEQYKVPYHGVTPGEIKKILTGKGNAGKAMMIKAANKMFNPVPPVEDDNQADALGVLYYGVAEVLGETIEAGVVRVL